MMGVGQLGGMRLMVSAALPIVPSDRERHRRWIRHQWGAEYYAWLGEEVGPDPDECTHAIQSVDPGTGASMLFVSMELKEQMMKLAS